MKPRKQSAAEQTPKQPTGSITDVITDDLDDVKDGGINPNESAILHDLMSPGTHHLLSDISGRSMRAIYGDSRYERGDYPMSELSPVQMDRVISEMSMNGPRYYDNMNSQRRNNAELVRAATLRVDILDGKNIKITGACGKAYILFADDYQLLKKRIDEAIERDSKTASEIEIKEQQEKVLRFIEDANRENRKLAEMMRQARQLPGPSLDRYPNY